MKKIILNLLFYTLTVTLFAQQSQLVYDKMEKAKRQIRTGSVLTFSGIGAAAIGTAMFVNGSGKKDPPVQGKINNDTYTSVGGLVGLVMMITAPVLVIIGIPDIIYGKIKKNRIQSSIQMTIVSFRSYDSSQLINGIGLCIRF